MNKAQKTIKAQAQRIAELERENADLRACCDHLNQAYAQLSFQFKQFQRHRFGQRSEAYIDPNDPQGRLFDLPKDTTGDDESEESNVVPIKGHHRKKKSKKGFADHLPRQEFHIKVPDEDRICRCGCTKVPLKPARHERLHYEPPVFEVHVELREQLVCPNGCSGEVVKAEKPKCLLPKARFTEPLLAHIIVSKLIDRQPYYHLEKQFESRAGFVLSRQSMARNVIESAGPSQPIYNLMKERHFEYDIGALDATSLQVLREPGRPPTCKSYVYCFTGWFAGRRIGVV